jgi:hypothetical protein
MRWKAKYFKLFIILKKIFSSRIVNIVNLWFLAVVKMSCLPAVVAQVYYCILGITGFSPRVPASKNSRFTAVVIWGGGIQFSGIGSRHRMLENETNQLLWIDPLLSIGII